MPYPDWPPADTQPALSYSNVQTYDRCRRKWFLHYLRDLVPPKISFDITIQRRLMPVTMLAGSIVDAVVKNAMRRYMKDRVWRDDLKADARVAMRFFQEHSYLFVMAHENREKWPLPRKTWVRPVDMVYYEGRISDAQSTLTMDTVDTCLSSFVRFLKSEDLHDCETDGWRIPPSGDNPNPWFTSGDVPIYAGYDFAVLDGSELLIIDWKAGKSERSEYGAREQLTWYATYANSEWGIAFENMTLRAVWLQEDNKITSAKVGVDQVEALRRKWDKLYSEQGAAIAEVRDAPERYEEVFPLTDDVMSCLYCPFRSCVGRTRLKDMHPEVAAAEDSGFLEEAW